MQHKLRGRVNPNFAIAGWVSLTNVRAIGGDGEVWNYALTLAFPIWANKEVLAV